ncbi:MAG TPA: ribosomal-processing cysteine protease Prp [Lactococcus sp.]|uniref:Ribosomal processing cysteine protease Prp n=1 Tax=Lactococcus muris TaxID=2941330 RepID=A0ABV4DC90_9LACT|nr:MULTISPECIES: ribosomal-processing cysteine protease Prp [Lactococcus]MBL3716581.1 ribosomal-processing cysteine protease Prp [Lactococcus garvieae]HAP15792.1 ribosomal-processing cysteine protease Prp [Lactococcus sp.]HBC90340.1 ribosomal-processing cysteine protease Prp [Lactococcus sp.]
MIEAVIRTKRDKIVSYEISGHAESGEYGHDVVCAAVSVLSITTANNLYEMAKIKPIANMEDGYLYVEIPLSTPERQGELAQTLLQAFENAMREVSKNYSQYITLKIENGGQYNA